MFSRKKKNAEREGKKREGNFLTPPPEGWLHADFALTYGNGVYYRLEIHPGHLSLLCFFFLITLLCSRLTRHTPQLSSHLLRPHPAEELAAPG